MYYIMRPEIKRVVMGGHSLGGSVATLLGIRYVDIIRRYPELYKPFYVTCLANLISTTVEFIDFLGEYRDRFVNVANRKDPLVGGLIFIIRTRNITIIL